MKRARRPCVFYRRGRRCALVCSFGIWMHSGSDYNAGGPRREGSARWSWHVLRFTDELRCTTVEPLRTRTRERFLAAVVLRCAVSQGGAESAIDFPHARPHCAQPTDFPQPHARSASDPPLIP